MCLHWVYYPFRWVRLNAISLYWSQRQLAKTIWWYHCGNDASAISTQIMLLCRALVHACLFPSTSRIDANLVWDSSNRNNPMCLRDRLQSTLMNAYGHYSSWRTLSHRHRTKGSCRLSHSCNDSATLLTSILHNTQMVGVHCYLPKCISYVPIHQ